MGCTAAVGQTNFTIWRCCAWAGPVFILGFLVSWALLAKFLPPPPQYWSADEVLRFYTDFNIRIRAGMMGILLFAPLYFVWSAVVSKIIQRLEGNDGVLANVELMGGVCTTIITLGLGVMWLGASFRTQARTPQDVQLLHDLGWLYFNCTFMVTLIQMVSYGTAMLMDRRSVPLFPQWMGWLSYATASTFLVVVLMPFVMNGPFAWHGLLTYWIALSAYFLWAVVVMTRTFAAIGRIEQESLSERSAAPEPAPIMAHA